MSMRAVNLVVKDLALVPLCYGIVLGVRYLTGQRFVWLGPEQIAVAVLIPLGVFAGGWYRLQREEKG